MTVETSFADMNWGVFLSHPLNLIFFVM